MSCIGIDIGQQNAGMHPIQALSGCPCQPHAPPTFYSLCALCDCFLQWWPSRAAAASTCSPTRSPSGSPRAWSASPARSASSASCSLRGARRLSPPACRAALSGITSNLKNTVTGMKAIIGKKFHSEDIQLEQELVGYRMVDVAGKVGLPSCTMTRRLCSRPSARWRCS